MAPTWTVVVVGALAGAAVGVALSRWMRRRAVRPDWPESQPTREQLSHRGHRAHAADLWACDPRDVTEAMREAARRDLVYDAHGAPLGVRLRLLVRDVEAERVPPLPPESLLRRTDRDPD